MVACITEVQILQKVNNQVYLIKQDALEFTLILFN